MQQNSDTLIKMVSLLNDGQYHDGTSLGAKLHITRAAVWKIIKKLEQYNISFTSTKGKGYMLQEPLILLNAKTIQSALTQKNIEVECLEKVDSTNQYLKKHLNDNKKIRVCLAETQTAGRGRLSRQWHSPFAKNIYLSLLYPWQQDISALSGLSLVISLALCRAIENISGLTNEITIKWPNDLLINGKKLAGSLIEIQAESNGFCQAIIGIGINVNMKEATHDEINQQWTSLQSVTDQYYDRNLLCSEIINQVVAYLEQFSHHDLSYFQEEWNKRDYLQNKSVSLLSGKDKYSGVAAGIDKQGHLILTLDNGQMQHFSSGDTTLMK
jgi:BirA family biotin operon repressor/biotin-[acetyl-CoA-carboxylase] ligase